MRSDYAAAFNAGASSLPDEELLEHVYSRVSSLSFKPGISDEYIVSGVRGFAREFDYWYGRVLQEAIPKYQKIVIDRINPMIRGMQLEGLSAEVASKRLVADYAHRNYVTAGGWALEQLAIAASPRLQKSASNGIDAEWREEHAPPIMHLFVIKSGTVTRNSDILAQLKTNGSSAQKRLLQTDKRAMVKVYYAVLTGQLGSTFHDGVFRPSSAEFWAMSLCMDDEPTHAIDLALSMAQTGGVLVRESGGEDNLRLLETAVEAYISDPEGYVDWDFIARRNMGGHDVAAEKAERSARAAEALEASGYSLKRSKK